ncbi:hypothetical protein PoB_007695900 [Plakobranchus ocellatus]|uniref:Uncharacterized protein n=1 Tax=Plakobranchus ocellatus TaxID=259542 RepID=A0AAV4E1U7_9GAST|nr:hypothetical protein PoB_007695900 [Plakobranchus ocellatus]
MEIEGEMGEKMRRDVKRERQREVREKRGDNEMEGQQGVMMVFRGSAEILGFGSEEEFPRFPRFRWLPRLQLNKRAMIRGVLRNENSTTCGRDDNFIDLR